MMRKIIFCFLFSIAFSKSFSQNISIYQDPRITFLMDKYSILYSSTKMTSSGYRIQLGWGNHTSLLEMKGRFISQFPDVHTYLIYQQPNYKLRVGDFTSQQDASVFMNEIKKQFPNCFIVPDKVNAADNNGN
jgi:hypothetical protein